MRRAWLPILLLVAALPAWSIDREPAFEDPALQARYERITRELRCLQCQNESIADSNAPLAADLRREIRQMIADGADDDAIRQFMVARYGDFVLYRPPFKPTTWVLWLAPLLLLGAGAAVVATVIVRKSRLPVEALEADEGEDAAR